MCTRPVPPPIVKLLVTVSDAFCVVVLVSSAIITEIGVFPKLDSKYDEIHDEITLTISDLVHDEPHAYDYLRGRTFARTLQ